ncbi:hypothetical protein [Burkholderia pseudomallei]|uniref:hypothetical protein n=1 Tax=Burkholderia pseudomallei TaxID=28450 RepID=UPI000A483F6F|nr:hypothetical protein [Burkholderia pseudomallei]
MTMNFVSSAGPPSAYTAIRTRADGRSASIEFGIAGLRFYGMPNSIYDEFSDPLAAAKHHALLTSDDEEDMPTRDAAQLTELTGVATAQP